jgi:hypothetical protein
MYILTIKSHLCFRQYWFSTWGFQETRCVYFRVVMIHPTKYGGEVGVEPQWDGIGFDRNQIWSGCGSISYDFLFATRNTLRRPMASGPSAAFGCPECSAGWCGVVQQCHQLLPDRSCGSPRRGSTSYPVTSSISVESCCMTIGTFTSYRVLLIFIHHPYSILAHSDGAAGTPTDVNYY